VTDVARVNEGRRQRTATHGASAVVATLPPLKRHYDAQAGKGSASSAKRPRKSSSSNSEGSDGPDAEVVARGRTTMERARRPTRAGRS
jgi:hypothetical protein